MKKGVIVFSVLLFIFVIMVLSPKGIYYNISHKKLWGELIEEIEKDKVLEVTIDNVELVNKEKNDFITDLKSSKFYKSNWRGEGPTGIIISIGFKNGHSQYFQYWGGNIFETSYKSGQFLIRSDKIKAVLDKYGLSN